MVKAISFLREAGPVHAQQPNTNNALLAQKLLADTATDNSPVYSGAEAAARLGKALLGGYMAHKAEEKSKLREKSRNDTLISALKEAQSAKPWTNPDTGQVEPSTLPAQVLGRALMANPDTAAMGADVSLQDMQQRQALADRLMADKSTREAEYADWQRRQPKYETVQSPYGKGGVGQRNSLTGQISGYQAPKTETPLTQYAKAKQDLANGLIDQKTYDAILGGAGKPSVAIDLGGDQKTSKEVYARYEAARTQGKDSSALLDRLNRVQEVASRTNSGFGAETRLELAKAMRTLGMDVDDKTIANGELFRTLQMDFILSRVADTKGAISEKEMSAFGQSVPGLTNTPEGNALIIRGMIGIERRKQHLARFEADLIRKNPQASVFEIDDAVEAEAARLAQTPLFNEQDAAIMAGGTKPEAPPQYDPNKPQISPEEAARMLKERGYRFEGGEWVKPSMEDKQGGFSQ